jgi:hypothetical protein
MEQNPAWKNSVMLSGSRKLPSVVDREIHCSVQKSLPPVPVLRHINPTQILQAYFYNFHFILPSTPVSSKWALPFTISNHNFVSISHLPHVRYMPRPYHCLWFGHLNNIWWTVQITEFVIMQFLPVSFLFSLLMSKHLCKKIVVTIEVVFVLLRLQPWRHT